MELATEWLGRRPYREAWERQRALVAARDAGTAPDTLLLVEHDAVLTLGRHADERHVLAGPEELARRGIEVIRVERGGEVTYHGPGQLVAYPIVRLRDRGILLRPFVRALESAMADVAATYGVPAAARPGYPGIWVEPGGDRPRKLGALGLRLERGITFHGIALNVTTRLADFGLIDPCGMADLDVTSVAREAGWTDRDAEPSTGSVAEAGRRFADAFGRRLAEAAGAAGDQPPGATEAGPAGDPVALAEPVAIA
jgi:lipoyl(octanoyl) transferase